MLLYTALFAIPLIAVPALASARHGADDAPGHTRQEDRRTHTTQNSTTSNATVEDNQTSVSPTGVDLRGDGTPEDKSPVTPVTQTTASSSTIAAAPPEQPTTIDESTTSSQAVAIANATLPGKTFKKVESETEHGMNVWSVRFQDGSRVDVSKADGSVLRVRDRADD